MRLSFSKHAEGKVKEQRIAKETLITVLENPQARFYDADSRAEVAVGEVSQQGISFNLVVVFRRRDDIYHIVTVYPVKYMRDAVERKVKIGRWISI